MPKGSGTNTQVSAGGVAYRRNGDIIEVALISVGENERWQLPKGRVSKGESNEDAAQREVREEAGIETELVAHLDTIDYWFYVGRGERRARIHKYVHFFLLRYLSGDPSQHDQEVNEARWIPLETALEQLAFQGEKEMVQRAQEFLEKENPSG